MKYKETSLKDDWIQIGFINLEPGFSDFKGLMLSTNDGALLDGDNSSLEYWRYAAGVCKDYEDFSISGPTILGSDIDVHKSTLYLRIRNPITCKNNNYFKFKSIILIVMISK